MLTISPSIGDRALVFDGLTWQKFGGDRGNNECFYNPATIQRIYINPTRLYDPKGELVCDVLLDNGKISRGHFLSGLRKCVRHWSD